jgi:hypothetical protein
MKLVQLWMVNFSKNLDTSKYVFLMDFSCFQLLSHFHQISTVQSHILNQIKNNLTAAHAKNKQHKATKKQIVVNLPFRQHLLMADGS